MNKSDLLQWVRDREEMLDADPNPFGCSDYLRLFIEQIGRDEWEYYVDGNSTLICYTQRPGQLLALRNYYTCLFSIQEAPTSLPDCSTMNLAPLEIDQARQFADAVRKSGWYVREYFASANHYLPCDGAGFDSYMQGRSSQTVNTCKRKGKKFPGRLEIVTNDQVERGIAAYARVYAKSWKEPEPYANFVPDWMRICAAKGWLRLGIAWVDETPIAAQFWFVRNGCAYVYKLAYDEDHKRLSAGTLLTAELMRHVLDIDRVVEVDYLTGDDGYKRQWMTHRRERVGLMCCNLRTTRGMLTALYEFAGASTNKFRRRQRVHYGT